MSQPHGPLIAGALFIFQHFLSRGLNMAIAVAEHDGVIVEIVGTYAEIVEAVGTVWDGAIVRFDGLTYAVNYHGMIDSVQLTLIDGCDDGN